MPRDATPPDLWTFALACYARPGVEDACLQLQGAGADVCLLLCGAWLQAREVACTPPRVAQLRAVADSWQREVVTPLRDLRSGWREAAAGDGELAALRKAVKALELEAEKTLLARLQQASRQWPTGAGQHDWLERLAPAASPACEASLKRLRAAAEETQLSLAG